MVCETSPWLPHRSSKTTQSRATNDPSFVPQGTEDSPVVLEADQPGSDWYGIVSCGNGVADLSTVEITGASENAAFVSGACEVWETAFSAPEVYPGIQVAP